MIYDKLVIALGNFMHYDLTPKKCFLVLADFIGMGILFVFLGICIFG